MAASGNEHETFVKAVATGQRQLTDPRPGQSWARCLKDYGLDPGRHAAPATVSRRQLQQRQESLAGFLSVARLEVNKLLRYLADSGHVLVLADADGVILNYSGDPAFNDTAGQLGLQLGALWAETSQGTNALGTCLVDGEPTLIDGQAHFFTAHQDMGAAAAPILDPRGQIIAALAVYAHAGVIGEAAQALITMAAETIENRYLLASNAGALTLRFHSQSAMITTLGEGLLTINHSGRLLAANRSAAFQLGYAAAADMLDRDIGELFNIAPEALLGGNPAGNAEPRAIYETENGRRFYASIQPSEPGQRQARETPPSANTRTTHADSKSPAVTTTLADLEFGDPAMAHNIRCASRILNHDIPVLLYGETGTGKELFSKALHQASERARHPYVAVNCASIPETLIESELFGYKGGAFTGARREGSRGKIVQANGGTLFLDEIGDMPLALQGRLLRVLEEREVLPLGSDTPIKVDIRLVSATHRDLPAMIAAGEFREDLYYRLQGVPITLPALRERQDKRQLIKRLLEMESDGQAVTIEDRALSQLEQQPWPGNLRQLCNVLRTLLVLRDSDIITFDDLPEEIRTGPASPSAYGTGTTSVNAAGDTTPATNNSLKNAERTALLEALESEYWNITRVARRFNVSRNTIYRKMKTHAIRPPRSGG